VVVLFAAPVRNRANDVDHIYHQNPPHYPTGYEEPEAVLVPCGNPQTLSGQPGITEALFVQPPRPQREWTDAARGRGEAAAANCSLRSRTTRLPAPASGKFRPAGLPALPTDVRDAPRLGRLYDLVATFRRQAVLPPPPSLAR
jgi:Xaa-Pro aminopeptidase